MLILGISFGILSLIILRFSSLFIVIRVNKNSMYPTLKDRDILLQRRKPPTRLIEGRIYVINCPSGVEAIKRLIKIVYVPSPVTFNLLPGKKTTMMHYISKCWFEGDNKEESYDSKSYGYLDSKDVVGEVYTWKEAIKALIGIEKKEDNLNG